MLSPETIAIVKSTAPVMHQHGETITRHMYENLLRDPAIRAIFDPTHQRNGTQAKALASAVAAYADHIDNLAALGPAVERIAERHVSLHVQPYHYDIVGANLLGSVAEVLGNAATPVILQAWTEAWTLLRDIFIGVEQAKYKNNATAPGGWYGWRPFKVVNAVAESSVIRSLYLEPADGGTILSFRPGQYLTLNLTIPGYGPLRRHYSLSNAPNGRSYRISVKHEGPPESGLPEGLASSFLHRHLSVGDVVDVAPPAGSFTAPDGDSPLFLLAAGVGITPLLSMAETALAEGTTRPLHLFHAVRNRAHHAFGPRLRALAADHDNLSVSILYEQVGRDDQRGQHHDAEGRIDPAAIAALPHSVGAHFMVCGPKGFMSSSIKGLREAGVGADRIRYEFFGSHEEELLD
ncbi:nitric oxide dioxygenase [Niveispirillum lacus]|uniref:Flavohemoprotein n=1 Tax=Niveispirillum lacus TaxID=1981099 RepID=A0A255YY11_9PROT|nr:NO-inducible flavohemoprotein [Niveispirillum lacus]OYQ33565.1 nitric oxide dioxygenase [Niveispirillum lacus]